MQSAKINNSETSNVQNELVFNEKLNHQNIQHIIVMLQQTRLHNLLRKIKS